MFCLNRLSQGIFFFLFLGISSSQGLEVEFFNHHVFTKEELSLYFPPSLHLTEVEIKEAIRKILQDYQKKGYFLTKIEMKREREKIKLFFEEGPQSLIEKISIKGVSKKEEKQIISLLKSKPGTIFREKQLEEDFQKIIEWYQQQGFLKARIEVSSFNLSRAEGKVSCSLIFRKGPRARLGQIILTGLRRTTPTTVFRVMQLYPGAEYKPAKIKRSLQALKQSPLFSYRHHQLVYQLEKDEIDLKVAITEGRRGFFEGVLGTAREGTVSGFFRLSLSNLLGWGMEGGGMYYRDDWHQNSSLQLNTGYLFPWQLSGRVSNYQEENLKQVKREVGVGVYLTSFLKIKLRRGEEKIQAEEMTLRKDSWGLDGNYNSVDDLFLPRQGIMVEVNFDWARREDLKFPQRKMTTNIRYFLPVSTNSILACRLLFSTYFLTHAEEEELFPFEYFKLGGMRNLRGFIEDQFRGTQVGLISLEYFFRFFFFFLDGGYVASPGQEIWPIGYGIGLRQKTKNRLISLCFGFGEGESLAEKFSLGKVHFQIKNIF